MAFKNVWAGADVLALFLLEGNVKTLTKQEGTTPVEGVAVEIESANNASRASIDEVVFFSGKRGAN
jgi:hypothetical protein